MTTVARSLTSGYEIKTRVVSWGSEPMAQKLPYRFIADTRTSPVPPGGTYIRGTYIRGIAGCWLSCWCDVIAIGTFIEVLSPLPLAFYTISEDSLFSRVRVFGNFSIELLPRTFRSV